MKRQLKHATVDAVSALVWRSGLTRAARRHRGRLTIVTFHRVLPEPLRGSYPYPGLAVTPAELDWCLRYFTANYQVDVLTRQLRRLDSGERSTRPLLAVTFDDGQWDNFAYAEPVLSRHAVSATFYVPTHAVENAELIWHDRLGYALSALLREPREHAFVREKFAEQHCALDRLIVTHAVESAKRLGPSQRAALVSQLEARAPDSAPAWGRLMSWQEVRALHQLGHEVGSHSVSHELMPQLDEPQLQHEVSASKRHIEAAIDAPVASFCYPNGDSDERTQAAVAQAGYDNAVTTRWGVNDSAEQRFALQRCDIDARNHQNVWGKASDARLSFRLSGLYPGLSSR